MIALSNKSNIPSTCSYTMSPEISLMYWKMLGVLDGNVLDVGSGQGGFGTSKPPRINLYGIERDNSITVKSKNYTEIVHIEIDENFVMPFEKEFFSGVLARDILEHIEKPWVIVDQIFSSMTHGGVFICSVPKADPKVVWNDYTHIRGFTKNAVKSLIENSGFTVRSVFPLSGYTVATRYGFAKYLPIFSKLPLINRLMVNYHCIAVKP
jgi:SAM-dependent methyltransferase